MKRQIRNGIFETNSSSMHSLVIKKDGGYYSEQEVLDDIWAHNDEWSIWDHDLEFGRSPFKCLCTFGSKVRYAIASLCSYRDNAQDVLDEISAIVYEVVPSVTHVKVPKVSHWGKSKAETYYGYVDEDILTGFLQHEGITLKEFLTNKKYVVIVDGDEYCIWDDVKQSGLVKLDNIEREYPRCKED